MPVAYLRIFPQKPGCRLVPLNGAKDRITPASVVLLGASVADSVKKMPKKKSEKHTVDLAGIIRGLFFHGKNTPCEHTSNSPMK